VRLILVAVFVVSVSVGIVTQQYLALAGNVDLVCGAMNVARGHTNKSPNAQASTVPVASTCSTYYLGGSYVRNGSTYFVPGLWTSYGQFLSFSAYCHVHSVFS
jgi:hypothetical protein